MRKENLPLFIDAARAQKDFGVSRAKAYEILRSLNESLKKENPWAIVATRKVYKQKAGLLLNVNKRAKGVGVMYNNLSHMKEINLFVAIPNKWKIEHIKKMLGRGIVVLIWILILCFVKIDGSGASSRKYEILDTGERLVSESDIVNCARVEFSVYVEYEVIQIIDDFVCCPSCLRRQSVD